MRRHLHLCFNATETSHEEKLCALLGRNLEDLFYLCSKLIALTTAPEPATTSVTFWIVLPSLRA